MTTTSRTARHIRPLEPFKRLIIIVSKQSERVKGIANLPGNFFGFLNGTNFAPIARAIGGPNIKPLASIPAVCYNC